MRLCGWRDLLLGGTVIFIVGLLDDIYHFSSFPQFIGQFLAAAIAIAFQIFIETLNNPLSGHQTEPWPFIVTVTLSFFWLVGMMNTVNWLDGVDGLAGGVAFIAGAMLFINSAFRVDPPQTSVSLLTSGADGMFACICAVQLLSSTDIHGRWGSVPGLFVGDTQHHRRGENGGHPVGDGFAID